jgi:hypothetical protein
MWRSEKWCGMVQNAAFRSQKLPFFLFLIYLKACGLFAYAADLRPIP